MYRSGVCVIVATGDEELREVMHQVIQKMIDDGELVPVYDGDRLVDVIVNVPDGALRNN